MDNDIKNCEVFSIDIENWKNHTFINIKIEEGHRLLLSAYEDDKIARSLFYIDKRELGMLIKGLLAADVLLNK